MTIYNIIGLVSGLITIILFLTKGKELKIKPRNKDLDQYYSNVELF